MNLNVLNDGTVATKTWLNPVCNVLTCNQVITTPSPATSTVYSAYLEAPIALPVGSTTYSNICGGTIIPNNNVVAGVYTALRDQLINVSINYSINNTVLATVTGTVGIQFLINDNPFPVSHAENLDFVGPSVFSGSFTILIPLRTGSDLKYNITTIPNNAGLFISNVSYTFFEV